MKLNNSLLLLATLFFGSWIIYFFLNKPEIPDRLSITVQDVQKLDQLLTARLITEAVVPVEKRNKLFGQTVGTTSFIYAAKGSVSAGLNLSNINADNVRTENGVIFIKLPQPVVFEANLDVQQSKILAHRKDWFAPDTPEFYAQAQRLSLITIAKQACDNKILDIANSQAAIVITNIFKTTNTVIEVETTPVTESYCIESMKKALNDKATLGRSN